MDCPFLFKAAASPWARAYAAAAGAAPLGLSADPLSRGAKPAVVPAAPAGPPKPAATVAPGGS